MTAPLTPALAPTLTLTLTLALALDLALALALTLALIRWDDNFAAAHGRQPTAADRRASKQYAPLKEQYVALRMERT